MNKPLEKNDEIIQLRYRNRKAGNSNPEEYGVKRYYLHGLWKALSGIWSGLFFLSSWQPVLENKTGIAACLGRIMKASKLIKTGTVLVLCLLAVIVMGLPEQVFAETKTTVTVYAQQAQTGQGLAVKPVQIEAADGSGLKEILDSMYGEGQWTARTGDNGVITGVAALPVKKDDTEQAENPVPDQVQIYLNQKQISLNNKKTEGILAAGDWTDQSGWNIYVNGNLLSDPSSYKPSQGDVIRLNFDLDQAEPAVYTENGNEQDSLAAACSGWNDLQDQTLTDQAYDLLGQLDPDASSIESLIASADAEKEQLSEQQDGQSDETVSAQNSLTPQSTLSGSLSLPSDSSSLLTAQNGLTPDQMVSNAAAARLALFSRQDPTLGTNNGEWTIICLARSGLGNEQLYNTYYRNIVKVIQDKKGVLSNVKYTEYSRTILGLTAIGRDVTNVGGYDLLSYMTDFNKIKRQGINGPIWGLIALDSHDYPIYNDPGASDQNSREKMVNYILGREITSPEGRTGGWAMSGNQADPDITAMAVYALSNYTDRADVKAAVDRAVAVLSEDQLSGANNSGGFSSWGTTNSESDAQVLLALTTLGIDARTDTRFIKNGRTVIDALSNYYLTDSAYGAGFCHVRAGDGNNGGGAADTWNDMATDQAMEALISYIRTSNGKNQIFDMSDVDIKSIPLENAELEQHAGIFDKDKTSTIQLQLNLTPEDNTDNPVITWSSSEPAVASVNESGLVTVHPGIYSKAKITVTVEANGRTWTDTYKVERGAEADDIQASINAMNTTLTESDLDTLVYLTRGFSFLTADEQQKLSAEKARLESLQEQASAFTHKQSIVFVTEQGQVVSTRPVSVTGEIPWNVQLVVTELTPGDEEAVTKEIGNYRNSSALQLCDIHFINLIADDPAEEWKPSQELEVTMGVPLTGSTNISATTMYHFDITVDTTTGTGQRTASGQKLDTTMDSTGQFATFKSKDFSPFAFVGTSKTESSSGGNNGGTSTSTTTITTTQQPASSSGGGTTRSSSTTTTSSVLSGSSTSGNKTSGNGLTLGESDLSLVDITGTGNLTTYQTTDQGSLWSQFVQKLKDWMVPLCIGLGACVITGIAVYMITVRKVLEEVKKRNLE